MARFARPPPGWLLMRKLLRIAGLVLDGVGLLVANNVSSTDAIPHLKRGAVLVGIGSQCVLCSYLPFWIDQESKRRIRGGRRDTPDGRCRRVLRPPPAPPRKRDWLVYGSRPL